MIYANSILMFGFWVFFYIKKTRETLIIIIEDHRLVNQFERGLRLESCF